MMQTPARYLVLIEQDGAMVARLYDPQLHPLAEFDGSSEEVVTMTAGLLPQQGAEGEAWQRALAGHGPAERAAAQVYTLDV